MPSASFAYLLIPGLTYPQNMEKLPHNLELLFVLVAAQVFVIFGWSVLIENFDKSRSPEGIALDHRCLAHKKAFTHTKSRSKY